MIEDTIQRIEARLASAEHLSAERRAELLELLQTLRAEVTALSPAHAERAQSLAAHAEASTAAAISASTDTGTLQRSLRGMTDSVEGFEDSHPRLVQTVSAISHALSNLGI